jgi:septum formation protein
MRADGQGGGAAAPGRLVLASGSVWRQALLAAAGVPVDIHPPDVDEGPLRGPTPADTARLRAEAKALAVLRQRPGCLVIGADQVAHLDGEVIGKPADPADHLRRLRAFRGRTHTLTTAVCLASEAGSEGFLVHTEVRFRGDLEDAELETYVASGEGAGCAGGYMVEKHGAWLIEAVDGDWTNVIGLPLFELISRLRRRGARLYGEAAP